MGSRRVASLGIFVVVTSACGGKLLTSSEPGADASSPARGNGNASQGDDTATSGGGSGGSSGGPGNGSTSGGGGNGSASGGGAVGGSASSGGGSSSSDGGRTVACTTGADCRAGTVCCGTIQMTTNCQRGPCPSTPVGPLQLCASDAECVVPHDSCGPLAEAPSLPIKVCNAPTATSCAKTCTGCCDADGVCTMGTADTACGSVPGSTCSDCTATGAVCSGRACTIPLTR
jgi:hypothetical protein